MIDINVFGTSFSTNVSSSVILVASEGSNGRWEHVARIRCATCSHHYLWFTRFPYKSLGSDDIIAVFIDTLK